MAKGEAKRTNQLMDRERGRLESEHSEYYGGMGAERNKARERAEGERGEIWGNLQQFANPDAYGPNQMTFQAGAGGGGGGGGGGGMGGGSTTDYLKNGYFDLAPRLNEAGRNYSSIASSGGDFDPRIRGTYGDFAETGGLNEEARANIRNRATSGIPAMYATMRDDMIRAQNARGGNRSVAYNAGMDRMARQQARQMADVGLNAETDIMDRVNQGRLAGASGLFGLDNARTGHMLSATSGLADVGKFGYGGLEDIADAERSAAASGAARAAMSDRDAWNRQMDIYGMRMGAIDRMSDLYGSSPAELARYDENALRERGMTGGQVGSNIGLRAQYNPNRSVMDNISQGLGIASGIGGMVGAGMGLWNPFAKGGTIKGPGGYSYDMPGEAGY